MADEFNWIEDPAERQRAYDDELVRRFEKGLPLTAADRRDAERILKQRAQQVSA